VSEQQLQQSERQQHEATSEPHFERSLQIFMHQSAVYYDAKVVGFSLIDMQSCRTGNSLS
jgi:hypothetical protein